MLPSERRPLTGNCALPTRTDPSTALPLDTSRSVIVSRDSVLVDSKRFVLDFWKPTESGSYLHPTSNHPPQVIRGIPYSPITSHLLINPHISKSSQTTTQGTDQNWLRQEYCLHKLQQSSRHATNNGKKDIANETYKLITPFNQNTNWKAMQSRLNVEYSKIVSHYTEPSASSNPKHAALLQNKLTVIVNSNEPTVGSHFSKYIKIPRSERPPNYVLSVSD